jgi:rhodanese-related sulfurtransferase
MVPRPLFWEVCLMKAFNRIGVFGLLAVLAGFLALGGCDGPKITDDNIKYVNDLDTVKSYMAEKDRQPVVLLDPRPVIRFEKEHAKGTINVPINMLRNGDPELAKAKTVIVIAGGFEDRIGDAAVKTMLAMKYKNVYALRGGVETWKRGGGAVESGPVLKPGVVGAPGTTPGATSRPSAPPPETLDIYVPEKGEPIR